MKAGKELDTLIHVFFFGKRSIKFFKKAKNPPPYSTDMRYGMRILDTFRNRPDQISSIDINHNAETMHWTVCIYGSNNVGNQAAFQSNSLPHAICMAAMLYKGWSLVPKKKPTGELNETK